MDIERREKDGSITIKSLRNIAQAMDMRLVYGFVPNDGSLEALIEKRANELATRIVMRTAATMKLEDQSVSTQRLEEAIKQRTLSLCHDMPKMLWD
jgi:predicted DNA-binding mobile mystery protein A